MRYIFFYFYKKMDIKIMFLNHKICPELCYQYAENAISGFYMKIHIKRMFLKLKICPKLCCPNAKNVLNISKFSPLLEFENK